jgi:hypothetical protein
VAGLPDTNIRSVRSLAYSRVMGRPTRGTVGEAAVLNAFVERGFEVLIPFGEGLAYDLLVAVDDRYLRVQCKTARPSRGCLIFNAYATDHGHGQVSYVGRADIFGVYFPVERSVYLVPVAEVHDKGRLRLEPTRNNQRERVRFAAQYEIDAWTPQALQEIATGGRTTRVVDRQTAPSTVT